jgi:serine/threonine protein kinase
VTDPLIVERAGTYQIEAQLAVGGFGVIYRGRAESGRPVAIKVLLAEHIGSRAVARFEREIAIVRRLAHPALCELLDAGRLADGRPYCVMELLAGRDLAAELERGPLAPDRVRAIVSAIAGALGVAHDAGIVHRDIKPSNVFLCDDGRVVLLDFGIAKLVADDAGLTMSRQTLGTIGAMAPEQLMGGEVDARTDVYALGVVAYHALTGEAPFSGDGAAQLHRFAQRPKPSAAGAPAAFDAIVARAMAIRPEQRYATAGEFAEALRGVAGVTAEHRRALAIHVDATRAPAAMLDATTRLAACGMRPMIAGKTAAVWWRSLDELPRDLGDTLRAVASSGVALAIHVDDVELEAGQPMRGPLTELWRWVPDALEPLRVTAAARDILEPI